MEKQLLINSLIEEFQNSKHRAIASEEENGAIVISTDYVSLVKTAVNKIWKEIYE